MRSPAHRIELQVRKRHGQVQIQIGHQHYSLSKAEAIHIANQLVDCAEQVKR